MRAGSLLKRHPLWVGFGATLVPLLVLVGLQYRALARLQRMTAIAHRAALDRGLEAIGSEVEYAIRSDAERVLNLPAWLISERRTGEVATLWGKQPVAGARRLFLVDFTREEFGNYWRYDPDTRRLVPLEATPEGLAVILASTPWQLFRVRGARIPRPSFDVNERDPDNRMILSPITDASGGVLGIAGMILDEDSLRTRILPAAIDHTLSRFFPGAAREDLAFIARDGHGTTVLSRGTRPGNDRATRSLPFVFTDWTLELRSVPSGPERWARASFRFNMTLGIFLALVLAGGVALALHAADRAMRLSQMKSDFVSNVSHELRTPLASIRVFAEFLRLGRARGPEQTREYAEYIDAESRRLTRIIDNILDFARIESGRKTYRFVDADLRLVVESTLQTFDVRLQNTGFRVSFTPPAEPLPRVRADPDAIGQALHNLLDNAVKYSGEAHEIEVGLERDSRVVALWVRDHGVGIERSEQRKIFERFHRGGGTLVHDVKGSGLGLAIVQHIAAAHGGHVGVESAPGAGSTFRIELPVSTPEVRVSSDTTAATSAPGATHEPVPGTTHEPVPGATRAPSPGAPRAPAPETPAP